MKLSPKLVENCTKTEGIKKNQKMVGFPVKDNFLSTARVHVNLSVRLFQKVLSNSVFTAPIQIARKSTVRASFSSVWHYHTHALLTSALVEGE
jgi:hypothetical protein